MTVWRIFKLVLAAGFLWFSIVFAIFACQQDALLRRVGKPLLRAPVDLSVKGETYHGVVDHIWDHYHHGLTFRIDTPINFASYEQATQVLNGLELAVEWKGEKPKSPLHYVLDKGWAHAYQSGKEGFVPAYPDQRWIQEAGKYELSVKVLKPCMTLTGIPQSLVVCYQICGVEVMRFHISLAASMFLGLTGLGLLGSTLYQWRTGIT